MFDDDQAAWIGYPVNIFYSWKGNKNMKLEFIKLTHTNDLECYVGIDQLDSVEPCIYGWSGAWMQRFTGLGGSGISVRETQEQVKAILAGRRGRTIWATDLQGNKIEVPVSSTFSIVKMKNGTTLIDQSQQHVYVQESPEHIAKLMSNY